MEGKKKDRPLVTIGKPATQQFIALRGNLRLTTDLARAKESLETLFQQIQRDVMEREKDREDGWAVIVGIQKVWEATLIMAKQGAADIEWQKAEAKRGEEQLLKQNQ